MYAEADSNVISGFGENRTSVLRTIMDFNHTCVCKTKFIHAFTVHLEGVPMNRSGSLFM